jgi:DNA-directed RNA polymerases I, II, and III subunit RPABC3
MDLLLDVAIEIYAMKSGERFHCVLAHSLLPAGASLGSSTEEGFYTADLVTRINAGRTTLKTSSSSSSSSSGNTSNLADSFDYVMYGKIYKAEEAPNAKVAVYISYGGLLMRLEGDPRHWRDLKVGSFIYLLIKRI